MGMNTTVLVLNDALGEIENDPEFGKKLVRAIKEYEYSSRAGLRQDISSGSHVNAASVIETHHSSETALVAMGGNYGTVIYLQHGARHHLKEDQWGLLENALEDSTKADKDPKPLFSITTEEGLDSFLDDGTNKIADMWSRAGGQELKLNEKYALNDLLTAFFSDKQVLT